MNTRNNPGLALLGLCLATSVSYAAEPATPPAKEQWLRIDFDADLTSYLVNLQSPQRTGDIATLWELNVPGRTSISTGGENHTLVQRIFDCKVGNQKLGEVLLYRTLQAKAEKIPHEDLSFKTQPGSIDDIEMKLACDKQMPAATAATVQYSSLAEAVKKAFGDAIKLPRADSNRTLRSLFPGGEPGAPLPKPGN